MTGSSSHSHNTLYEDLRFWRHPGVYPREWRSNGGPGKPTEAAQTTT